MPVLLGTLLIRAQLLPVTVLMLRRLRPFSLLRILLLQLGTLRISLGPLLFTVLIIPVRLLSMLRIGLLMLRNGVRLNVLMVIPLMLWLALLVPVFFQKELVKLDLGDFFLYGSMAFGWFVVIPFLMYLCWKVFHDKDE